MSKYSSYVDLIQSRGFLKHTVTQDNALVRAKYNYNYRELKLSRLISSKINPFDSEHGYKVRLKRDEVFAFFSSKSGKKYGSLYNDFDTLMNGLNSKPIHIPLPGKKVVAYWVSDYEYDYETQEYTINIPEKIRPFLIALKNSNNTSIPLYVYDVINSSYLCRLYEILYSYRNMRGGRVKYHNWTELRDQIGCDYEWKHFNSRILKKGREVFPKVTSMSFTYSTIKKPKSKEVQGIDFVITINKPDAKVEGTNKPSLFPEPTPQEVQMVEDIKHTLLGWDIPMETIEKLLHNPFEFIDEKRKREEAREKYSRLEYIWGKMEYVINTENIKKSKASLFMASIQNNYESIAAQNAITGAKKKAFEEKRQQDMADLENERTAVRKQHYAVVVSVVENILSEDTEYRQKIFELARKQYDSNYDMSLANEQLYRHSNPLFRTMVIHHTKKDHPKLFKKVDDILQQRLSELEQREAAVRNRKFGEQD